MHAVERADADARAGQTAIRGVQPQADFGRRPCDRAGVVLPHAAEHVDVADVERSGNGDSFVTSRLRLRREWHRPEHDDCDEHQKAEQRARAEDGSHGCVPP